MNQPDHQREEAAAEKFADEIVELLKRPGLLRVEILKKLGWIPMNLTPEQTVRYSGMTHPEIQREQKRALLRIRLTHPELKHELNRNP